MVFHGDYELQFEIYETRKDDWRCELLGYMVGIDSEDAKMRWMEAHQIPEQTTTDILAIPMLEECP